MEKIDIVILWVDDNDLVWKEKRNHERKNIGLNPIEEVRYRSWDNLHYLFRGIEKFASWVNKTYLVTDDQIPFWLNTDNKKVQVVDHKDIISDDYLPLYNSSAIEINIHKIQGLSDKFIYFNDDMFLIDFVYENDFFENNKPKDTAFLNLINPYYEDDFPKLVYNNLSIINNEFKVRKTILDNKSNWFNFKVGKYIINNFLLIRWNYFSGIYDHHLPISFKKQVFYEVWDKYEKDLQNTLKSKFRNNSDYTIWLFRYWQIASNDFVPRSIKFGKYYTIDSKETALHCSNEIREKKYKMICANDSNKIEEFADVKNIINSALESILSEKSSFEK